MTANHQIVPPGYGHWISAEWMPPYRYERIRQLLQQAPLQDIETTRLAQTDTVSLTAQQLLPSLPKLLSRLPQEQRALGERMAAWNGDMSADQAEPLL